MQRFLFIKKNSSSSAGQEKDMVRYGKQKSGDAFFLSDFISGDTGSYTQAANPRHIFHHTQLYTFSGFHLLF
jgi:hypothetical protein